MSCTEKHTKISPDTETEKTPSKAKKIWTSLAFTVALILLIVSEYFYRKVLYDEPEFKTVEAISGNLPESVVKAFIIFSKTGGGTTLAFYTIILSIWFK